MDLMDLKQEAERSKHGFWLFLIEQSLHDPQFDIFTQYGQFCGQVDQVLTHTEQAFAELDAAAEETRAKMAALISEPSVTLSPKMENDCDCAEECEDCRRLRGEAQQGVQDDTEPSC